MTMFHSATGFKRSLRPYQETSTSCSLLYFGTCCGLEISFILKTDVRLENWPLFPKAVSQIEEFERANSRSNTIRADSFNFLAGMDGRILHLVHSLKINTHGCGCCGDFCYVSCRPRILSLLSEIQNQTWRFSDILERASQNFCCAQFWMDHSYYGWNITSRLLWLITYFCIHLK